MAYPTRLLGNLIPGCETFSICHIGVPLWFQSEEKPGPDVSRPPGCPPPLNGCLHLPRSSESWLSPVWSLFLTLAGVLFLN